jgi:hypothetical protein
MRVLLLLSAISAYVLSTANAAIDQAIVNYLRDNKSPGGMPLSFWVPPNYWESVHSDPDDLTFSIERVLATYGLNLYDGACWQIALAVADPGYYPTINAHTRMLLSGKSGDIGIRAMNFTDFVFGTGSKPYDGKYPYFFRMISDHFYNKDPLTGEKMPWMDWKPVTGENAWLALLGPLLAYNLYVEKTAEPLNYYADEMQIAIKQLDVFLAMQSPIGAVYYAPKGTYKVKNPTEIACENNISLYAGLQVLRALLLKLGDPEKRIPDIDKILIGIEQFFKNYAYNAEEGIFYQGGVIENDKFVPNPVFPLDVQTWGLSVIGQQVDSWFGETTAYKIWQASKKRSGTFDSAGNVLGVGYTDGDEVISVEWTMGAVNMARILAKQYESSYPDLAQDLLKDARTMRLQMENYRYVIDSTHAAYQYADKRYNIPFGWYSNPIPSAASTAWVLMMDNDYNPFHISGEYIQPPPISTPELRMELKGQES